MDKVLHALVGALVFAMAIPHTDHYIAFLLVIAAGVLKEVYDLAVNAYHRWKYLPEPHTVDPVDGLATVAGGWAAMTVHAVISLAKAYLS